MADLDLPATDPRDELVAVLMAGGTGSRFWPASTEERPKQFLSLFGERSLLQQARDRLDGLVPPERILVVTNEAFADLVRLQLPELPPDNVIGEPARRDTAAAVTLAAQLAAHRHGNPIMALFTADHVIGPVEAFQRSVLSAARGASAGEALYTFGIRPDHAATGYGYLELGATLGRDGDVPHHDLSRFVEKPDLATAQEYVAGGSHLWNSGMFVWRAGLILEELERQLPGHCAAIAPAVERDGEPDFQHALAQAFEPLPKISIDFGVMENARSVRCVEADFSWADVGSFVSLADHLPVDDDGNARHRGRVFSLDA